MDELWIDCGMDYITPAPDEALVIGGTHLCRGASLGTCWRYQAQPLPGASRGDNPGVPCRLPGKGPFPPAGFAGPGPPGMLGRTEQQAWQGVPRPTWAPAHVQCAGAVNGSGRGL